MSRKRDRREQPKDRLANRRRDFEEHLTDMRHALDSELGVLAPRGSSWVLPLVGLACGLALALALTRR